MGLDRRRFLRGSTAVAAGLALGGPFQGFLARAAVGAPGPVVAGPSLYPTPDLRDGVERLALPPGFRYRSFDVNPTTLTATTTALPGNHDGMAAFSAGGGKVLLIRNHETNGSVGAFASDAPLYDTAAPGGVTYALVDHHGNVDRTWAALTGTQMNCAGAPTPWRSWITCEESINGPDVFDDFTRAFTPPGPVDGDRTYIQNARLTKQHGYLFEVPASGSASGEPVTAAGRFAKEAAAFHPGTGSLYLTEDNFGFGSGFYRYDPPVDPRRAKRIEDGGTLWMLALADEPQANLSGGYRRGTRFPVTWVRVEDPNPTFPTSGGLPTLTNNRAICYVGRQGYEGGGAVFSRLEGCAYDKGLIYFTSTQGGGVADIVDWEVSRESQGGFGKGGGQVWAYDPRRETLELVYQSTGPDDLDLPDNIVTSPRGTLILCEDNPRANMVQALTRWGQLIPVAQRVDAPRVEFAGATFSPNGETLYVNLQTTKAMSLAIWGPWADLGI